MLSLNPSSDVVDIRVVLPSSVCVALSRSDPSRSYLLIACDRKPGTPEPLTEALSSLVRYVDEMAWLVAGEVTVGERVYQAFEVTEKMDEALRDLLDLSASIRVAHKSRMERSLQLEMSL